MGFQSGPLHDAAVNLTWAFVVLSGVCGLVALISPRWFATLVRTGNLWVDTSRLLAKFDRQIDVDSRLLPYSRVLGVATLASVGVLACVLAR